MDVSGLILVMVVQYIVREIRLRICQIEMIAYKTALAPSVQSAPFVSILPHDENLQVNALLAVTHEFLTFLYEMECFFWSSLILF